MSPGIINTAVAERDEDEKRQHSCIKAQGGRKGGGGGNRL